MLLIANPQSGKSKGKRILKKVESILERKEIEFDSKLTESGKHAEKLGLKGVKENYDKVVVIGGDGTVSRVARNLIGTDVSMGIIPAGTGNDLSESLNIPQKPSEALDLICSGSSSKIDVGRVSFSNKSKYFVNVFGMGFDARVAKNAQSERLSGFALNALKELPVFKEGMVSVSHRNRALSALMVIIANGKRTGKYFRIAPDADLTDGKFTLLLVEKLSLLKRIECLTRAYFGRLESMSEVHFEEVEKVEIDAPDSWMVQLDGEPTKFEGTVKVEVVSRALKVISNYG